MRTMYILRTDQRPTDLTFWKISNGHISATGHLIHFMFGSRVGFSRSADRMALLLVGPNQRWRPASILEIFKWPYFCNGSCDLLPVWFYGRFSGRQTNVSISGWTKSKIVAVPSCRILNGHISETVHRSNLCLVLG